MDGLKVSVALTVFNEEKGIQSVIDNLLKQTRRPDEIVVCDGGSRDDTLPKLQQLIKEGVPLKVVVAEGACRGKGRNLAIEAATYPVIALTDAGLSDERWLEYLLGPCLDDASIKVVYGAVMPIFKGRFSRCLAGLTIGASHVQGRLCPSVASLLFYREVWEKAGGFPEGLTTTEDLIFLDRLKAFADISAKAPDALVYWSIPGSLAQAFQRLSRYSEGSLVAGFAGRWHLGMVRNYIIMALIVYAAAVFSPWLLIGLPCFQALRVHRYFRKIPWIAEHRIFDKVGDYALAGVILIIMDLATLNGVWRWIINDKCSVKEVKR